MRYHRRLSLFKLALLAVLAAPACAYAYIDPNAGGLLYQILFPVIVAIGAAWAGLRHYISHWWVRLRGRRRDLDSAPDDDARRD